MPAAMDGTAFCGGTYFPVSPLRSRARETLVQPESLSRQLMSRLDVFTGHGKYLPMATQAAATFVQELDPACYM